MLTAPQLFAQARGVALALGPHRCFYCGGACDGNILSTDHVKESFTARDTVCGGEYVCNGCIEAMDERGTVTLVNGEVRQEQKLRCYTYVVADGKAIAATKSHREYLLAACLHPPAPPFVVCLSDSGQKHLLYRAVVCHSREVVTVTLEGERITYRPPELESRLALCKKIIAATGKPALAEPLTCRSAMAIIEHHDDETLPNLWSTVWNTPLSRLAAWLSPAKEGCLVEYPSRITAPAPRAQHGGIPSAASRVDRPAQRTFAYGD